MDNDRDRDGQRKDEKGFDLSRMLLKVVISAVVIAVAAFFSPGFSIDGLGSLLLAAVVIGVLNYLIQKFAGLHASPFGRGIVGFLVAAIILYVTKFVVAGFHINMVGAIIGALIIGIIDAIMPGDEVF